MANYICKVCSTPFKMNPAKGAKYCSHKCYSIDKLGKKLSPKHCANISKVTKGKNNPFYGKKHTPKTCKKMRLAKLGKYLGSNNLNWKGGKVIISGRLCVKNHSHPFAPKNKYIEESRLIVEKHLGRYLTRKEIVHHIDFNKANNSPKNLFVFENKSAHTTYHLLIKNNPFLKTWLKSNII